MRKTAILVATFLGAAVLSSVAQPGPSQTPAKTPAQNPPQGQANEPGSRGGFRGRGSGANLMGALDLNSDGILDAKEIQNASLSLRKLDTNRDLKLTPDELGSRGGPGGGDMSQRMLEMDKNKDGKLTADEIPERMQRFFERMDANGDGAVDKKEMETFQQEMRRRFDEGRGPESADRPGPGGPGGPPEN